MANFLGTLRRQLTEFIKKLSIKKRIILISAIALLIILSTVLAVMINKVDYQVLYSGLSTDEAGTIISLLSDMGVTAKAKGTDTILVPATDADEVRMELAAQGYPQTGLNYDIFTNSSSIGSTDLEKRTYLQYQLQENLRTTISWMDKVKDCLVIVNLPSDSSYVLSTEQTKASASVVLELEDDATLTDSEVKAIGELVSKSVTGLTIDNVRVVDTQMKSYDLTGEEDTSNEDSVTQYQLTEQMKETLKKQALNVLQPVFGANNVSVSVNLSLNFDQETVSKVEFAPPVDGEEKGLVRSSEENKDTSTSDTGTDTDTDASGAAGTDSNGGTGTSYTYSDDSGGNSSDSSSSAYDYELNQVTTDIKKAQGSVEDLSVSVLVNSNIAGDSDYKENLVKLVANSIGVDEKYVSVEMLPFFTENGELDNSDQDNADQTGDSKKDTTKTVLITLGACIVAAAAFAVIKKRRAAKQKFAVDEYGHLIDAVVGDEENAMALDGLEAPDEEEDSSLLKELNVKKSNRAKQIEKFMDKYPEEAAQILRNWLSDEY